MWVSVSAGTKEDGSHSSAKLSIGLSRIKGAEIPDGETIGAHAWSGMLCDGTTATVNYTVTEDGTIVDVTASPEGAEIASGDHSAKVRFATGESVHVGVRDDDGQLRLGVDDQIHCDAADPLVNTPIDVDADTGDDSDRGDRDHRSGDRRGDDGSDDDGSRDGSKAGDDESRGNHRHDGGDD